MSQHTDGPWVIRPGDGYPLQVVAHDGPGDPWVVAEICDEIVGLDGIDQCEANARLISAAPDLWSFAKAYVRYMEIGSKPKGGLYERAKEAIAKATQPGPTP